MMKVLNTNGWMYAVELEEPTSSRPGRYFLGNKVRGTITTDLEQTMQTMSIPEVPKGTTAAIPDEIEEAIQRTLEDEESAAEGRLSKTDMHEHISERHKERHPVWPRIAKHVREILHKERKDTASIEEIYSRYI